MSMCIIFTLLVLLCLQSATAAKFDKNSSGKSGKGENAVQVKKAASESQGSYQSPDLYSQQEIPKDKILVSSFFPNNADKSKSDN
jgi:hypothetical protein